MYFAHVQICMHGAVDFYWLLYLLSCRVYCTCIRIHIPGCLLSRWTIAGPHSSTAAVTMLAVPAIAGLTVDGRFLSSRRAPQAMAVDHRDNAKICKYATSVDAETACSPGCRSTRLPRVVVDVTCCRAAARTPSPVGPFVDVPHARPSSRSPCRA
jgi:hypothetical protein